MPRARKSYYVGRVGAKACCTALAWAPALAEEWSGSVSPACEPKQVSDAELAQILKTATEYGMIAGFPFDFGNVPVTCESLALLGACHTEDLNPYTKQPMSLPLVATIRGLCEKSCNVCGEGASLPGPSPSPRPSRR